MSYLLVLMVLSCHRHLGLLLLRLLKVSWMNSSLHQASWSRDAATWMLHGLNCISMNATHITVIERHAVLLMMVIVRLVVLCHHVLLLHGVILILIHPGLVLQNFDCLLPDT